MMVRQPRKRYKYEKARFLRERKGLSYNEIRSEMPLAKSTISDWCRDIKLTKRQLLRLNRHRIKSSYAGSLKGSKSNQEKRNKEICRIKK